MMDGTYSQSLKTMMRNPIRLLLDLLTFIPILNVACAATSIRMETGPQRQLSHMAVEAGKVRMQSEPGNYILIDPSAATRDKAG